MKPRLFFSGLLFFLTCATFASTPVSEGGRVDHPSEGVIRLIGAASYVAFDFKGASCKVRLAAVDAYEHHNYVCFELDGNYLGRFRIEAGPAKDYSVPIDRPGRHHLVVYKATEASNGYVDFLGTDVRILPVEKSQPQKKIEFIGDSITSGMGNDASQVPCGSGEWYDQHNAYWSYAPIAARQLGADFLLSSVSGIGLYRNWNTEPHESEIMPHVYDRLYLKTTDTVSFGASYQPDIVTICLGTNDLSGGDGVKPRAPFDADRFVAHYLDFVGHVAKRYPKAKIALLSSPMLNGERHEKLLACLRRVQSGFAQRPLELFVFDAMQPKGCGYHPDISDDKVMAAQLVPFLKKLLRD